MEIKLTRRKFLLTAGTIAVANLLPPPVDSEAMVSSNSFATLIDLTKCDGCKNYSVPLCVSACKEANRDKFPEPDRKMLKPYWPQKFFDDWSSKRDVIDRLTPYNWIFVQRIKINKEGKEEEIFVPRRCMHCDNPPCAKLCPFGVNKKHPEGPVTIDCKLCFGGAKCKDVCPWGVPQRQAGVGVYTYLDPLPVGGGVMYKCDLCFDRVKKGQNPVCVNKCPKNAISFGRREEIFAKADLLAREKKLYIYGKEENGGTSTLYLSPVTFEELDKAVLQENKEKKQVMRFHKPKNMLDKYKNLAKLILLSPFVAIISAFISAKKVNRED
ncbi:MAG: 4Fe-4S dicluster domain-containing protein [Proteobacteria bacterium]|nr:4Fe-4S dicluster domain-containing protein [Pseudomonadota bacterium]